MNKNRKFVYLLALLFTVAFGAAAIAAPTPPGVPDTDTTAYSVDTRPTADFTAKALLEDGTGTKLNGYEIEFTFKRPDSTVIDTKTAVTGDGTADGIAKVTFSAPSTEATDYSFRAYFAGTVDPDTDYSSDTEAVEVSKDATSIFEVTGSTTVKAKEPISVTAGLDSGGNPLSGKTLKFELLDTNDTTVLETITKMTGPTGEATAEFAARSDAGGYSYRVTHPESAEYLTDSDSWTVTVEKIPTVLEVRTINLSKRDRPGSRVRGGYSLNEIGGFYRTGPKRRSCVFIHTYTHSAPGVV